MCRRIWPSFRPAHAQLIECYLDALDVRDAVQLEMRLTFLQLLSDADHYVEVCAPRTVDAATIGVWMSRAQSVRKTSSFSSGSSAASSGLNAAHSTAHSTDHSSSGTAAAVVAVNPAHLRVGGVVEHLCALFPLPAHLIATVAAHLGTTCAEMQSIIRNSHWKFILIVIHFPHIKQQEHNYIFTLSLQGECLNLCVFHPSLF